MWPFDGPEQLLLADFLYSKVQMSAGDTNYLMRIWDAWQQRYVDKKHNDDDDDDDDNDNDDDGDDGCLCGLEEECDGRCLDKSDCDCESICGCDDDTARPPFKGQRDLLSTIDSIPQGDIAWRGFQVRYEGEKPENPPSWMEASYDVWYWDVLEVMEAQLGNPEFADHIDYAAKEVRGEDGQRLYTDLMSGEWAWEQSVSATLPQASTALMFCRTSSKKIQSCMAPCFVHLFSAATRPPSLSAPAKTSTILSTHHQGMSRTTSVVRTKVRYQLSHSLPFPKVRPIPSFPSTGSNSVRSFLGRRRQCRVPKIPTTAPSLIPCANCNVTQALDDKGLGYEVWRWTLAMCGVWDWPVHR